MPSHQTPPSGVSATLVKIVFFESVAMALGFVFADVPGATPKNPYFGIDGAQEALRIGFNPGDVIAYGPDFPAIESCRWDHHGEVGFAAGTGECRGYISFFALRIFHAEDEHVLRHPTFVAGDVGGDAESETFFA